MVQHCVNAASTDFASYNAKKQRDAADVVGSKSSSINSNNNNNNNALHHHILTLGSMQYGTVDFVSNVLPLTTHSYSPISNEPLPSDSALYYKTNTTVSSSSSSGYESVLSNTSKSRRSFFSRLKRLMNFPSTKKLSDYQISNINNTNEQNLNNVTSPIAFKNPNQSAGMNNNSNEQRKHSLTRVDIRRKSTRRTLAPATQHVPFVYGLKNCGNTCFINAIVQCLCHTEQLASYFLRKGYEIDIRNIKNAIVDYQHSSTSQLHGFKVTKSFVQIFQALWNNSSNTTSKLSYDFKTIIGNLNRQYSGNEQNDAQEFLLFLINTIHDELNLVANNRVRQQTKNSFSSTTISSQSSSSLASVELARRAWSDYTDANQSIITSTFSAQLHSTLRCNQCKQESKTFEPYLLLSLPIPQKIIKPVFITVVFLNQSPKQLQIALCLPVTNTVKDVREAIAQQSNLDPNDLALVEIQQHTGFSQVFHDTEPMSRLTHDIFAIQFPSSRTESNEHVASAADSTNQSSLSNNSYVNLLVLNRVRLNSGLVQRFGAPIAVRVPRESNYRALQLSIIKAQRSIIRDEAMEYAQEFVVFQLSLIDQYQSTSCETIKKEYPILYDVQWPLYLEKIVEILDAYDGPGLGPSHIQVYANWHEKYLGQFISKWGSSDDKPDIHQSVAQARAALHQPSSSSSISLADCFSLFTQSESLNHDDAWMCTHCRRKENGTVKNLKISTLPPVLIIHLKRFCQTKMSNSKLVYPVQFPLVGLDVRGFLSTKKNNDDSGVDDDDQQQKQYGLYDLYSVCNHRGSMSNGHYTAYCKNSVTEKWFCYDDHLVSELDPSRVCTPDAYILFYRCRDTPSSTPSESITKSSSSHSQLQQIDATVDDFDERLNLYYSSSSSNLQASTPEEDLTWPITNEKQHHYTLQPPLPLPRKLLTPLPSTSSSPDEFPSTQTAPCPMPRVRKPQYKIDVDMLPSGIILPPSPPTRRQQRMTPTTNYLYPISSTPLNNIIEPLNDFYSSSQRYNDTERLNPWSHYNSQRYADSEQEPTVVYSRNILR
ncbi:unnamed protein product [Rotaria socialis]|uniref:ubiquitinyl hydrolase 1 n=1 Tax=Rotaria socialis TaxID=392032 RepID=A0A818DBI6_9BILA|nr:unnamed protein product [Rotaria socialis]CAF3392418.1 unnamed protein product [Rotaria socialis]CAF3441072.1 unnamed protein product [Rotaria socialis]CAF3484294.1 unnamed protein product [Rotaria socialis]CAF4221056.1 unnamed protein product [Rotaria socialis]